MVGGEVSNIRLLRAAPFRNLPPHSQSARFLGKNGYLLMRRAGKKLKILGQACLPKDFQLFSLILQFDDNITDMLKMESSD